MQSNYIRLIKLLIFFALFTEVSAQTDPEDFDFDTPDEMTIIPDSLSGEDAVIILKEVELAHFIKGVNQYNQYSANVFVNHAYYKTIHKRIKIQTQYGLDEFAQMAFSKYASQELSRLEVRCIKPDRIIKIDSTDIFTENYSYDEFQDVTVFNLAIPGVEIGDEIEFIVVLRTRYLDNSEELFFHDDYPVMESRINLIFGYSLEANVTAFNDVPKPIGAKDSIYTTHTFKLEGLKGIKNQSHAIMQNELPFLFISRNSRSNKYTSKDWMSDEEKMIAHIRDVAMDIYSYVNQDGRGFSKKEIMNLDCINDEMSDYEKFYAIHNEINRNMDLTNLSDSEENQPVGYFFRVSRTDYVRLNHIYVTLFNLFDIDFDFIVAKNRFNGNLDLDVFTFDQIDQVFFRFINENDEYAYLFTKTSDNYYEINEIPRSYIGADAIIIPRSSKVKASMIKLKYSDNISHFENRQVKTKIISDQDKLVFDVSHCFGGSEYTRHKYEYNDAEEAFNEEAAAEATEIYWLDAFENAEIIDISIDSLSATYMKTNYSAEATAGIVQLEENIFSLPIKDFIYHYYIYTQNYDRILDYYPISDFVRKIKVFILFDHNVQLINQEDFDISFDSPICSYKINAAQINDSTMYLQSDYCLKAEFVAAEDYDNLREVNKAVSRARDLNLIYSMEKK